MKPVFDTGNLETLLLLKRQEADALRDVIRAINGSRIKPEHIFLIAQNTLLAQLRVRKMIFLYRSDGVMLEGIRYGFPPEMEVPADELPQGRRVVSVSEETHPILHGAGVEYVLPFSFQDNVNAWFLVAEFAESEEEVENDLIFIETIGNILAVAVENRELINEFVRQEALRAELEVAEKIQKQLLPSDFSMIEQAEISAMNLAHHKVGGDFYDVVSRGEKGFFICIADVSGKGMPAALLMASLLSNLRALILSENQLESVIRKLHTALADITQGDKFVTLFLAHVRTEDHEIDYINAGHNPPVLRKSGTNELMVLNKGTIPLGILDLPAIEQGTVTYGPEDLLFLYTDGLLEQTNKEGEFLGEERIAEALQQDDSGSASTILQRVLEMYRQHSEGVHAEDDITLMAVRFTI